MRIAPIDSCWLGNKLVPDFNETLNKIERFV